MPLSISARCQPLPPALLPHTVPAAAWQILVQTSPELLFWPLLARRSTQEQPWAWAALGFPGLTQDRPIIDTVAFDLELDALYLSYLQHDLAAAAIPAVERGLAGPAWAEGALDRIQMLGARLLGPISVGLSVIDEQESPLLMSLEQRDALAKFMRLRAAWLEANLSSLAPETLICLDEPFLDALRSPFLQLPWDETAALIEEVFASLNASRGIAPGCHVDWEAVLRLPIDLVICPAEEQERLLSTVEPLSEFLQQGGIIAWELVPADEMALASATSAGVADQLDGLFSRAASLGLPDSLLVHNSLLTVDGTLDHLSITDAERVLALLSDVSALVRSRYGLIEEPTNLLPSQS